MEFECFILCLISFVLGYLTCAFVVHVRSAMSYGERVAEMFRNEMAKTKSKEAEKEVKKKEE